MKNKLVVSLLAVLVIILAIFVFTLSSGIVTSPRLFEREITEVENTSSSDEINEIEKDLTNTNLDNLGKEISSIENEIR